MPIKPKKRMGRHPGTGGPRYCQPPGKSGCKTSAQTARVVFTEATCRAGAGIGVTGRRIACSTAVRGGVFFGCAVVTVPIGGIFADAPATDSVPVGAAADGGRAAGAPGDGAAAGGGSADATTAAGRVRKVSFTGGDAC